MPIPNASFPADPHVLTLFQEELARAAGTSGLAPPAPALWPRFAGYYRGLARLPRKLRRALQRRRRRSLGGIALLCALGQAPVLAATIVVDGTTCTLVDAINAANNDAPAGGCTAGSGADRIVVPGSFTGSNTTLTTVNNNTYGPNGLPVITSEITISSLNGIITRDTSAPEFRILTVGPTGNLTLEAIMLSGGIADSGGGIQNLGTVALTSSSTLIPSTISGNTARFQGGGIVNSGTLAVTNSTVSGNTAGMLGGGIQNRSGTMILTNSTVAGNTVAGNTAYSRGGGVDNLSFGTVILTDSTVSGNTADRAAGLSNLNTAILTNSTVSGNTADLGAGVFNIGTATLTNSTVSGNTAGSSGGGIYNDGTIALTNSTVEGNSAQDRGGGIYNRPASTYGGNRFARIVTLTSSTVSGNTAGMSGGGTSNNDTLTVTNSTVSGNTAVDRGGGTENTGTMTLTSSTVSGNASGRVAGGLLNTSSVTLVQTLLSGNTAPVNAPEAYSVPGASGPSTVNTNGFNVVGHDGSPGVVGFTLGATDVAPAVPLAAILDTILGYNGGPTRTHALVFGSPAVDVVFGAPCVTATDQRGAPRAQDGDGDGFADCDSGAVERGQIPVQASLNSTRVDCRTAACQVPVTCNLTEAGCTNEVEVTVRRPRRNSDGTAIKAPRVIRFAAGVANIPPGGSGTVTLTLTKPGKRLVRATTKRRLKGVLGIREIATTVSVSNTPLTISRTDVTIRLKRRK